MFLSPLVVYYSFEKEIWDKYGTKIQSTIWDKNLVYLHTSSESKHALAEITMAESKKPAAAGAVTLPGPEGLLHCLYSPSYQCPIIAAALPSIAARNLEHRFETKIILYT